MSSDDPLLGLDLGSYRLVALMGEGGMGRVYRGVQREIGAQVAIKVLTQARAGDAELVARFFTEARAVAQIRHDAITQVLDLGSLPDGRPYLVMEHLEGATLGERVRAGGPQPVPALCQWLREALGALGAAHRQGIIHRDFKPENLFVTVSGRAKVLDFGLARLTPQSELRQGFHTRSSALMGTPPYLAPELLSGQPADVASDIWAAGVTLYEGACGRRPFVARQMFELLREIVADAPPPPRSLRADLPPAVEAVILRALEKQPARRWGSADEMAAALATALAGGAIAPPPEVPAVTTRRERPTPEAPEATTRRAPAAEPREVEPARARRWPLLVGVLLLVSAAGLVGWLARGRGGGAGATPPAANVVPGLAVDAGATGGAATIVDGGAAMRVAVRGGGGRGRRDGGVGKGSRPSGGTGSMIASASPIASPSPSPITSTSTSTSPITSPSPSPSTSTSTSPTTSPSPPSGDPDVVEEEEETLAEKLMRGELEFPAPARWAHYRLDGGAIAALRTLARKIFPDAELFRIDVVMSANGDVDLAASTVAVEAWSPARKGRVDHYCAMDLTVSPRAITASKRWLDCGSVGRPPRCTPAEAFTMAAAKGLDAGTTAHVVYASGRAQWTFRQETVTVDVADDCR